MCDKTFHLSNNFSVKLILQESETLKVLPTFLISTKNIHKYHFNKKYSPLPNTPQNSKNTKDHTIPSQQAKFNLNIFQRLKHNTPQMPVC